MKKFLVIFKVLITIMLITNISFANNENYNDTNEIIDMQKETLKISDFINEAQQYTKESMPDIDINKLLANAIKGDIDNVKLIKLFCGLLGKEILNSVTVISSIIIIIIIHGILKSITDGLNNKSVAQITYYIQYILIVTLIMSNFTEIIKLVKDTSNNLVGFINVLIPLLLTLMVYTGSIATSTIIEPIVLFISNFVGNIISDILIPIVLVIVVFSIVSKISERVQIEKISKFLKSGVMWALGVILTVFVGVVSLEGTLSSSVDGITAKTAKAAVSTVIPVVGKVLGDVVDSVLGCGVILKNAVGFVGVIVILSICIMPIIKIGTLSIIYSLASAVVQPIADEKIVKLLDEMSGVFKLLLGILCALSVILIIGITMVVKISNSGMMYR